MSSVFTLEESLCYNMETWRQTISTVYFVDYDLTFMKHRRTVVDGTLSSWSPNISSSYKVLLYICIQCFLRYKLFGDLWPSTCILRCWIRWERTMTPQQMNSFSPHPTNILSTFWWPQFVRFSPLPSTDERLCSISTLIIQRSAL